MITPWPRPIAITTLDDVRNLFVVSLQNVCGQFPVIVEYKSGPTPNSSFFTVFASVVNTALWDIGTVSTDGLTETMRGQCLIKVDINAFGKAAIEQLYRYNSFLQSILAESFYIWPFVGRGKIDDILDLSQIYRAEQQARALLSLEVMATIHEPLSDGFPLDFNSVTVGIYETDKGKIGEFTIPQVIEPAQTR